MGVCLSLLLGTLKNHNRCDLVSTLQWNPLRDNGDKITQSVSRWIKWAQCMLFSECLTLVHLKYNDKVT